MEAVPVPVKLKVLLFSTSSDSLSESSRETLYIYSSLDAIKVKEIKAIIQRDYSIPVCIQTIKWAGSTLQNERFLRSYGLQENDELEVLYHSRGDCYMVEESVKWLKEVVTDLKKGVPNRRNFSQESFPQLMFNQQDTCLRRLWAELFQPWHKPEKYTNKLYFVALGGVDMLVDLHKLVLQNDWNETPGVLKYTEFLLLHAFWSFGETFNLQRLTLKKGAMELFLKSLERLQVDPNEVFKDKCVTQEQWLTDGIPNLSDIADGALGVLSNFCELREGQEIIAKKHNTLQHLLTIMMNQGFTPPVNVSVAELMMQVSNDVNSHSFLSQKHVVEALLYNPFFRNSTRGNDTRYKCLSTYFAMQCIGRVLLMSPHLLSWLHNSSTTYGFISSTIESLLPDKTLKDIMKYEDDAGYLWYTLMPNVAVLFRPLLGNESGLYDLQVLIQTLFVSTLCVILRRKGHTEVLCKEGLVDFIVCLPWYSSVKVCERAKELVIIVRRAPDIHYQPPSLLNISKAAVAVYYCGLDDVMRLTVPELVWKILQE